MYKPDALLFAVFVLGIAIGSACSKGDGGGQGAAAGEPLTSQQLARLAPMKVGEFELDTTFLSLPNPRLTPGQDPRSASFAYHHGDEQIVVRIEDKAANPNAFAAHRKYLEDELTALSQNVKTSEDGDVYRWVGVRDDVPEANLLVGGRFTVSVHGRDGTPMAMLEEFVAASGLIEALKKAPAAPGPDERPAWAANASPGLRKPPERAAVRGWCAEWIPEGLLAKHCETELAFELGAGGDAEACEVVAKQGGGGGSKDKVTVSVRKAKPERWDVQRLEYPEEPKVDDRSNRVATWVSFSSYPNIVHINAAKHEPVCTNDQLQALAAEIKQHMPAPQPAPKVRELPGCDALLPASDVEQICGKAITVKSSGMDDGALNVCNHGANGLIFLLSRHGSPETARKGAVVAAGGDAQFQDRQIHVHKAGDGFTAVAPVRNLLLELKSTTQVLGAASIPCTEAQLEKLAEKVVGRLK